MPRIPTVRENDPATASDAREFLRRVEGGFGEVFNSLRLLANHPRQGNALIDFVGSVRRRNGLAPTLTELAYTTASVVNSCHY
jgi:alkylhydroperoxidase family enzyme